MRTFATCAPFYDALTAHHDYEDLTDTLERLLETHGHPGTRLLDVACGTGKSFLPFLARGYELTACDVSAEMLDRARTKSGDAVRLLLADMRDLPDIDRFDIVTCIDEPLNYLLEREDVAACFRSLARNLRPGGLLLFDLNTLHAFQTIFARDECYEQEGWLFVWRGHGHADAQPGVRSGFTIEAFVEGEPDAWTRLSNQHLQRHYPMSEVRGLLGDAGLETLGIYGMSPDGALDALPDESRHTKVFYVAQRWQG